MLGGDGAGCEKVVRAIVEHEGAGEFDEADLVGDSEDGNLGIAFVSGSSKSIGGGDGDIIRANGAGDGVMVIAKSTHTSA